MHDIRADQRGVVGGLINLSRNLGLITGASVMGTVFAAGSGSTDLATALPHALEAGLRMSFAVATGLILLALAVGFAVERRASRPANSGA
ncbi:hypothetical protein D9M68_964830 [compost metagenome]